MHRGGEHSRRAELSALVIAVACVLLLAACTVKTDNKKNGDKNVNIETPVGGVHVNTDADARDVGLAVYPGATPKPKSGDDSNSANVSLSTGPFGLRVVALEYVSKDSPEKVAQFYKKELGKYGDVIQCPGKKGTVNFSFNLGDDANAKDKSGCDSSEHSEGALELRAGEKGSQHIVSIKPGAGGSEFALVYVSTRGKDKDAL